MRQLPLVLLVLAACSSTPRPVDRPVMLHVATTPVPREDGWWNERHAEKNKEVATGEAKLLFVGDSITHGWENNGAGIWNELYAPRKAINLGFSGDRTQHVLWRFDNGNLYAIDPTLAVIMIGTNNSNDDTPEQIADGVRAIVQRLIRKFPDINVLILGIFPRGADSSDLLRQVNDDVNEIISQLADGEHIHYLDIGRHFLKVDGSSLSTEIMPDLLHLSERGYRIWADSIEAKVAELMGERG